MFSWNPVATLQLFTGLLASTQRVSVEICNLRVGQEVDLAGLPDRVLLELLLQVPCVGGVGQKQVSGSGLKHINEGLLARETVLCMLTWPSSARQSR